MTNRAAILGLGSRGVQWAEACLAAGWEVTGFDPDDRAGRDIAAVVWSREGTISGAVRRADWIICCLPERIELLRPVLRRAQASAHESAIIAVVSETFQVDDVQDCAIRPGQVFRLIDQGAGDLALDVNSRNDAEVRARATDAMAVLGAAQSLAPPRTAEKVLPDSREA